MSHNKRLTRENPSYRSVFLPFTTLNSAGLEHTLCDCHGSTRMAGGKTTTELCFGPNPSVPGRCLRLSANRSCFHFLFLSLFLDTRSQERTQRVPPSCVPASASRRGVPTPHFFPFSLPAEPGSLLLGVQRGHLGCICSMRAPGLGGSPLPLSPQRGPGGLSLDPPLLPGPFLPMAP